MKMFKRKKMTLLFLHVMVLFALTQAFNYDDSSLDNTEACVIDEDLISSEPFMECICFNRENLTMSPVFNYDITRITIKGCGTVYVPFAALTNLQLEELEFTDIQSLIILPFALQSPHGVPILKISDIANLEVKHHAFVGLYNVDTLIISNVTSQILTRHAFNSISNVRLLLIEDSVFNYVEQLAFAVHNVTVFKVLNSQFHTLENCSFLVNDLREVRFEECLFQNIGNSSFIMSYVDSLYFLNCKFGEFATTAVQSSALKLFNFSGSTIEVLHPDAFADLEVQDKIVFTNNTIQIAYENSLTPIISSPFKHLDIDYCCNSFTCDCNVYWMWNLEKLGKNNSILESSTCIGDANMSVSLYTPVMDSYNNCMTLELSSLQTISIIKYKDLPSCGSSLDVEILIILCMFSIKTVAETFLFFDIASKSKYVYLKQTIYKYNNSDAKRHCTVDKFSDRFCQSK